MYIQAPPTGSSSRSTISASDLKCCSPAQSSTENESRCGRHALPLSEGYRQVSSSSRQWKCALRLATSEAQRFGVVTVGKNDVVAVGMGYKQWRVVGSTDGDVRVRRLSEQ